MPGGLMQLVAYGAQDIYLTGNPQITFFKVVYRRHTNFSMESIKQVFEGDADYGNEVTCTIARNGDLVHRMYLEHDATLTHELAHDNAQVNLVERYGDSLIKSCEIEIGGQLIDRHTSMWNRVYSDLTEFNPSGYILNSTENPDNGINSSLVNLMKGNGAGYNTGPYNSSTNTSGVGDGNIVNGFTYRRGETSVPSAVYAKITVNKIFLPLNFWFNRNPGLALPLIALQYHEVKIRMEFESDDRLARYSGSGISYANTPDHKGAIPLRGDNGGPDTKMEGNFDLWCDYIYLDTDERRRFAQVSHEYLIDQLQIKTTTLSEATEKIKLNFNHPVKELIWTMRNETLVSNQGSDSGLGGRHGHVTAGGDGGSIYNGSSLGAIPGQHRGDSHSGPVSLDEMGGNWKLKLNGKERFKSRDTKYFTRTQVWQHHTGYGGIPIMNTSTIYLNYSEGNEKVGGDSIAVYSFALKPEEHQPSGTCNFSRIDSAELIGTNIQGFTRIIKTGGSDGRLGLHELPANAHLTSVPTANNVKMTIFAVNYNVLRIMSGMGGLAYSN